MATKAAHGLEQSTLMMSKENILNDESSYCTTANTKTCEDIGVRTDDIARVRQNSPRMR